MLGSPQLHSEISLAWFFLVLSGWNQNKPLHTIQGLAYIFSPCLNIKFSFFAFTSLLLLLTFFDVAFFFVLTLISYVSLFTSILNEYSLISGHFSNLWWLNCILFSFSHEFSIPSCFLSFENMICTLLYFLLYFILGFIQTYTAHGMPWSEEKRTMRCRHTGTEFDSNI